MICTQLRRSITMGKVAKSLGSPSDVAAVRTASIAPLLWQIRSIAATIESVILVEGKLETNAVAIVNAKKKYNEI